jgi:integrase
LTDYQTEHAPYTASPERIAYSILNLSPFFGNLSVSNITNAKCKEYATDRNASDGTIRRELGTLRAALNHDKKEGRIEIVPHIWMPEPTRSKDRWLTRKEAAALLKASRNVAFHLPWFILISLYSGQRKQAVLSLTWDRVDLDNGTIDWQYGRETKKRRIRQPMPDELKMFLKYLSRYGTDGYVLNIKGRKIGDIRKGLEAALTNAKINNATPHTLKHTAITWMLQNGTDLWSVAGFTGTSVKTLETTYGHHSPDYLENARTSFKTARRKRLN